MALLSTINLNELEAYHDILINNLMPRTPRMKLASKVFKSKKVTEKEAKKVAPLTKYWAKRLFEARISDNPIIFWRGFVLGGVFLACVFMALKQLGV